MSTNRLFMLLVAIALTIVAAFTVREAFATTTGIQANHISSSLLSNNAHYQFRLGEQQSTVSNVNAKPAPSSIGGATFYRYRQGELEYCTYTSLGRPVCRH